MINKTLLFLLCFLIGAFNAYAVVPQPYTVYGTLTVDGVQVTSSSDDEVLIEVLAADGSQFTHTDNTPDDSSDNPHAETSEIGNGDMYSVSVPIYESNDQPEGATEGESAVLKVTINGSELNITSPIDGTITIGSSTEFGEVNISASTAPEINVSPVSLDLGSVMEGTTGSAQSVAINNTGNGNLSISSITLNDTDNFAFVSTDDKPCDLSNATVEPSDYCTFGVAVTPNSEGDFSSAVVIASDDSDESSVSVAVSGTGTAIPKAEINVTPATKDYGSVIIDNIGDTQIFTIENEGDASLSISNIELDDEVNYSLDLDGGDSACASTSVTLLSAESCTVAITFVPSAAATHETNLTISSNDDDEGTLNVELTGVGAPKTPEIAVSPSSHNFGTSVENTTGDTQVFTISNIGEESLQVNDIALSDEINFTLDLDGGANGCGTISKTIASEQSCTVSVTFSPRTDLNHSANIQIESNDSDESTLTIQLSGVATAEAEPEISLDADTLNIGVADKDAVAPTGVLTISNTGHKVLSVSEIAFASDNSAFSITSSTCLSELTDTSFQVAAEESCTLTFSMGTTSTGSLADTFTITSDDTDEETTVVTLMGKVFEPKVEIPAADSEQSFGLKLGNATATEAPTLIETVTELDTDTYEQVYPAVSFKASVPNAGDTAAVSVEFPDIPEGSKIMKCNGSICTDITDQVIIDGTNIIYDVVDGGSFDADGLANGVIEDPIMVAADATAATDGDEEDDNTTSDDTALTPSTSSSSSGGGCSAGGSGGFPLLLLMLFIGSFYKIARNKR